MLRSSSWLVDHQARFPSLFWVALPKTCFSFCFFLATRFFYEMGCNFEKTHYCCNHLFLCYHYVIYDFPYVFNLAFHNITFLKKKKISLSPNGIQNGLLSRSDIGVVRGGPRGPPNWNATNDKIVTKRLLLLHFHFLLASSRTAVHAYNSNQQ